MPAQTGATPAKKTDLSDKQLQRGDAALIARKLLVGQTGPFSQSQADVFDIIRLAEWIMEGEQEETSITLQPAFGTDNSVAVNPNIDNGPFPDLLQPKTAFIQHSDGRTPVLDKDGKQICAPKLDLATARKLAEDGWVFVEIPELHNHKKGDK